MGEGTANTFRSATYDVARGICLALVIERHAALLTTQGVWAHGAGLALEPWLTAFGQTMMPLRMPAMMFVAGILARATYDRFGDWAFLRRKAVGIGYPALLWVVIFACARTFTTPVESRTLSTFLMEIVAPTQPVWFVQNLTVFFMLYGLLGRRMIFIGLLALVFVLADTQYPFEVRRSAYVLHFFALGTVMSARYVAELVARWRERILLLAAPALGLGLAIAATQPREYVSSDLLASYAGTAFLLALSAVVVGFPALARPFIALGRQALQVYLLHWPLMLVGCLLLLRGGVLADAHALFATLFAIGTVGAYALGRILLAGRGRFLFELPAGRQFLTSREKSPATPPA
jgi:hypothetical protein